MSRSIKERTGAALSLVALTCAASVAQGQGTGVAPFTPVRVAVQAVSLLGDTLRAFPLSAATRSRYETQLADARRAYERTPATLDSIVWYGRRLAYLGQLREAIAVYTHGLALFPDNPWLLRHRGHRYLSVREIDRAIADLERAAALSAGKPDVVEPDGQPNAAGVPIGTLQSNIGYHLALAYYLRGNWRRAADVARSEVAAANNDDRRVSMAHWLYMSLRRAGRDAEAAAAVEPFRRPLKIVENQSYERLMHLYLGELVSDTADTPAAAGQMSSADASLAYGVANWHLYNGRRDEAVRLMRGIVEGGQWGAFGFIAAEADLARLGGR
jgi:tetratricopeptide (TPR) repeat protein